MKALELLDNDAKAGAWAHAYLFVGGGSVQAEIVLSKVISMRNCLPHDVSRVEAEQESGKRGEIKVEKIRALLHELSLSPHGTIRIGVLVGAERLNLSSANVLLKTLEEPPAKSMILLFASNDLALPTIRSRCRIIRLTGTDHESQADTDLGIIGKNFLEITKKVDEVVKNNETDSFLNILEADLRQKMIDSKSVRSVKLIKKLELIRKDIRNNANPKLALESLILLIKEMR